MTQISELRLMTRVAKLYHEQNLHQTDIADRLSLSQAAVSRLLKRAKHQGIIKTTVNAPRGVYTDLEDVLLDRYGLNDVIIADCIEETEGEITRSIGSAAAYYLDTTLRAGDVVGVSSWSSTILAMVDVLHPLKKMKDTCAVQMLGGKGKPAAEEQATHLLNSLASQISGKATFLPANAVASSMDEWESFQSDPSVKEALAMLDGINVALVGIGAIESSRLLAGSGNIFTHEVLNELKNKGAVGHICLRFFNEDGKLITSCPDNLVTGMSIEKIKKVKRSVGMAGGKYKVPSIKGSLEGRFINVLITDHYTARRLVHLQ